MLATNEFVLVSTDTTTYAISQGTTCPYGAFQWRVGFVCLRMGFLYVVAVDAAGETNGTVLAVNLNN